MSTTLAPQQQRVTLTVITGIVCFLTVSYTHLDVYKRQALTFTPDVSVKGTDNNYQAKINGSEHDTYVAISFYTGEKELSDKGFRY